MNYKVKSIEKEMAKIKKNIEKTKSIKVHSLKVTTLKELNKVDKENKQRETTLLVETYISAERRGVANLTDYSNVAKIHRNTFKKYVEHYKKFSALPTNGNIGREPANKIKDSVILKIVKETDKYIEQVQKYAKEAVPTSWSLLYYKIMPIVNKRDP